MAATQVKTEQIFNDGVTRDDLNAVTVGKAVVKKLIAGTNVTLSSTGADAGTGDVTINATGGSGTFAVSEAEIDVGATPVSEAQLTVTDAGVSAASRIIGGIAYEAPTGKDLDEIEMDALDILFLPGTGNFDVRIKGLEGYIADKFKIWYTFA